MFENRLALMLNEQHFDENMDLIRPLSGLDWVRLRLIRQRRNARRVITLT